MTERLPSDALMDAVLSGAADASSSPGLDRVATLVRAARAEATASECEIPPALLEALAGSVARTAPVRPPVSRLKRRLAAAAGAVVLTSSGMAAAATTNSLPAPVQHVVADAVSHVGVHLPRGTATAPTTSPPTDRPRASASSTTVVPANASTPAVTAPGRTGSDPPPRSVPHATHPHATAPPTTSAEPGSSAPGRAHPPVTTRPHSGGSPPSPAHPGDGHRQDGEHGRTTRP